MTKTMETRVPERVNGVSGIACSCQFPEPQRLVLTDQMICTSCGHGLFANIKREAA